MNVNVDEKSLEKILIKFLFHEPFFASIIRSFQKIRTDQIPTAGVTIKDGSLILYWNQDFLNSLTMSECIGLFKHECYHIIYKHILKRKHDPHILWNIATDLAINSIIPYSELPKGGFIPGRPLEFPKEGIPEKEIEKREKISQFIESLPPYKTSEYYMNRLLENDEIGSMIEEVFGSSDCGFDVHIDPEIENGEESLIDAKIKTIIGKAVKDAQSSGWGSVSSEVREQIVASVGHEISWKDVLRNFCGTKQRANKSRSFRKINRKYPYIHPGRKISHTSNLAIYIDQSGSVSDYEIQMFFDNLNTLAKKTKFTVYHFDSTVDANSKYVWDKRKKVTKAYRTRSGGTNFNAVEMFHRKIQSEYDGYLILSDGECFKPETCKSKRCFVILPGRQLQFVPDKRDTVVQMKN